MNKYRIFIVIGVAALVVGRLVSPVVHAQDDEGDGIRDQIQIMTKILEASVGKDTIDGRVHFSVFESRIRTEYIPTVGAIFTIPISFPLHPSEDEQGNAREEVVEEDLWEHFLSVSERASKAVAPALAPVEPVELVEPIKIHVNIDKDRLEEQVEQLKARTYSVAGLDHLLLSIQDGFSWNVSIGNSKPYDPVKVSTLTHTIIETIAHYGHRLKSMPNSERVLVVLEAPKPRASVVFRFGEHDENSRFVQKPILADRAREIVKEKKIVIERDPDERRLRAFRARKPGTPGLFFRSERIYDHRLLAFKKSDLQQERSYDSIKGKVETTDY